MLRATPNTFAHMMSSTSGLAYAAANEGGGAKPQQGAHTTTEVDTSKPSGFSGTLSMDVDGTTATSSDQESTSDHIEVGGGAVNEEPKPEGEEQDDDADETKPDEGDEDSDDKETDEVTEVELPEEFKADDPEVLATFDKALKSEDGKLRMDALSAQWWANAQAAEDGKGHLTEATYAYLDHLGIPPEMVKAAEAGQQALNTQGQQALYQRAGGKANLDEALKWGGPKEKGGTGGYTDAQQKAFNDALKAGGEKANDAIDLLMTRFEKANKRSASPRKTAAENASGGKGPDAPPAEDVFETRDQWIAARREAGRDVNKQAEVSRKYRNSPNATKW